jgi:hypothetical protein
MGIWNLVTTFPLLYDAAGKIGAAALARLAAIADLELPIRGNA